jgi:aspartate aminotransferase, cytoplasmic
MPSDPSLAQTVSSTASTVLTRVRNIASHIMATSAIETTSFPSEAVPQAPEDPLFGLSRAYKADESKDKVDLVRKPIQRLPG